MTGRMLWTGPLFITGTPTDEDHPRVVRAVDLRELPLPIYSTDPEVNPRIIGAVIATRKVGSRLLGFGWIEWGEPGDTIGVGADVMFERDEPRQDGRFLTVNHGTILGFHVYDREGSGPPAFRDCRLSIIAPVEALGAALAEDAR